MDWYLYDNYAGRGDSLSIPGLQQGDKIYAILHVDSTERNYAYNAPVKSRTVIVKFVEPDDVEAKLNLSADILCEGDSAMAVASLVNGGIAPRYIAWYINGEPVYTLNGNKV